MSILNSKLCLAAAGLAAIMSTGMTTRAANIQLGSDVFGQPVRANSEFYVDLWFKSDDASIGLVASDIVVTYSGDLEVVDDPTTLLASQATQNPDLFVYDDFAAVASIEHDPIAQTITYIGGVNLLGGSQGVGQSLQKAPFARMAFRNIDGGGFTVRIAGNMGVYGEVVGQHDWLGAIGDGPTASIKFIIGDGGMGLP